jgi:hypothetical protein
MYLHRTRNPEAGVLGLGQTMSLRELGGFGQPALLRRLARRRSLLRFAMPTQEQRTGNCPGWMSDPESFSKAVADHYVRTEYPSLSGRAEKIWCRADKKICQVDYSTGIQVGVSFVRLPDYVIARRWAHPTGPRCEYDFDCRPSGELVLTKRSCRPS